MIRNIALCVLMAPLVSGCAVLDHVRAMGEPADASPREIVVSTEGMPGSLEPIHAAAVIGDRAIFRVTTAGCTDRDDILPVVTMVENEAIVTLRRMEDDFCQAYDPEGLELVWTFEELGLRPGQRVRINNPWLSTL